ncbi:MAG: phosphate acyltransferase PlsX [bacterium]
MSSTIIVDAMGGDNPLDTAVDSSLEVCKENPSLNIILVGSEKKILNSIDGKIPENLSVVNAENEIRMGDLPAKAYREKIDSSVHKGVDLLVNGKGDAFFSSGNTGATVAVSYFKSGVIEGISRPALATVYPSVDLKKLIILDLGATLEPKPANLFDFGVLGEAYRFCITGLENSRISILNVGQEETKGTKTILEAAEMFKNSSLNFTGFIEGDTLFTKPETDVVVTDAFTGNVTLKTVEGLSETIGALIKSKIAPPQFKKTRSFIFNKVFGEVFNQFQYNLYGAAILLGANHLIGVGHGKSDKKAFKNGVLRLHKFVERDFLKKLKERVAYTKNIDKAKDTFL